jgi:DNA-binding NtrC family response regulator
VTTQPIILIIDDDRTLGQTLRRLAQQAFPDHQILWTYNALSGLAWVREHAAQLRLIVLDIQMPLLNGNLAAAQIRALAPTTPILPFTSHAESLGALAEMGCVTPILKHPDTLRQMPALMRAAMETRVAPMIESAWVAALRQSAQDVLRFAQQDGLAEVLTAERETAARAQRALGWLDKYCGRFATPAREVVQARRVLQEAQIR